MLPERTTSIDAVLRGDHEFLHVTDRCRFFGEFWPGARDRAAANSLIANFKIAPSEIARNPARAVWKRLAIAIVAAALSRALERLPAGWIVVPIPTSKVRGHPEYDDRMLKALALSSAARPLIVRELLKQRESTTADHEASCRRQSFGELLANCYVDEAVAEPQPSGVVLVDDVLTQGKHFKVCQRLLWGRYGSALPVTGLFIARRVPVRVRAAAVADARGITRRDRAT